MPYSKEKGVYIMKFYFILITSVLMAEVQFTNQENMTIQQSLVAPCCGNGVIYEHEDNAITRGIKKIIKSLTKDSIDNSHIEEIVDYYTSNSHKMMYAPPMITYNKLNNLLNEEVGSSMTKTSIVQLFEKIHGPRILSAPDNSALGLFAWLFPYIVLFSFLVIGIFMINKLKKT